MMTRASNKADGIAYSWHDMPLEFSSPKGNLKNYYSANGTKLKTVVEPAGGGDVSTIHYFSGIEYKDEELHTAYWEDGRANFAESEAQHEYYLKDHLGNTRVRFADKKDPETGEADGIITYDPSDPENDEVLSTHQYYPFDDRLIIATAIKKVIRNHFLRREPKTLLRVGGWDVPNVDSNGNSLLPTDGETKYTYIGEEFVDDLELELMDLNARWFDPAIGRFLQIDPLAENFSGWTGYHYSHNNPILLVDPTGMAADTLAPGGFETDNVAAAQDRSSSPQFRNPSIPDSEGNQSNYSLLGWLSQFFGGDGEGSSQQGGMELTTEGDSPGNNNKSVDPISESENMDDFLGVVRSVNPGLTSRLYKKATEMENVIEGTAEGVIVTTEIVRGSFNSVDRIKGVKNSVERTLGGNDSRRDTIEVRRNSKGDTIFIHTKPKK